MSGGYRFEDNDDEGIFNEVPGDELFGGGSVENVKGAAGDKEAADDIVAQSWVPGVQMSIGKDGLVTIHEPEGAKSILDPPPPVDAENFICLAGPCRHYTENAQLLLSGPAPDADESVEVGRWCGRIRTWAEQTDLTEMECFACTAFEPAMYGDPSVIRDAISRNANELAAVRRQAVDVGVQLGICVVGPCESFVEQIVRTPTDEIKASYRWCVRLGGLGRLYDLRERPVLCCNGWKPVANSSMVAATAVENNRRIAKYRKLMAERGQED